MTEPGIEVIAGCMFSGKTEETIRRLRLAEEAGERVVCFKPSTDTRSPADRIENHCGTMSFPCIEVCNSWMIVTQALRAEAKTIGIDEAQFLQGNHYPFLDAVQRMVTHHEMRLIIAGLDMDWKGQPFGPMGDLLACADIVTKLWARCPCGKKATMTLRGPEHGEGQIVVGDEEIYQPRCRACWSKEMRARPGFAPLDGSRWP